MRKGCSGHCCELTEPMVPLSLSRYIDRFTQSATMYVVVRSWNKYMDIYVHALAPLEKKKYFWKRGVLRKVESMAVAVEIAS